MPQARTNAPWKARRLAKPLSIATHVDLVVGLHQAPLRVLDPLAADLFHHPTPEQLAEAFLQVPAADGQLTQEHLHREPIGEPAADEGQGLLHHPILDGEDVAAVPRHQLARWHQHANGLRLTVRGVLKPGPEPLGGLEADAEVPGLHA